VSHSARLAEGTADLAAQVGGGTVTVIAAGGTDDVTAAPFVEGAVAATVTAAAGADLKAVAKAAEEAWHASKLGDPTRVGG